MLIGFIGCSAQDEMVN